MDERSQNYARSRFLFSDRAEFPQDYVYVQTTHLVVEAGEVCVSSKNNPALIWTLLDQELVNL